jgi:hypothetical protein
MVLPYSDMVILSQKMPLEGQDKIMMQIILLHNRKIVNRHM